jgi:hypothetical protein
MKTSRQFLKDTIFYNPTGSKFHLYESVMTPHGAGEIVGYHNKSKDDKVEFIYYIDLYYKCRAKDNRIITTKGFELSYVRFGYHQKFISKL